MDKSNILRKHVHSVKIRRNIIWCIAFYAKTASVTDVFEIFPLLWFFSFSDESLKCLQDRRHSHIGCICVIFCLCVFSYAPSKHLPKRMHTHTGCICLFFFAIHFFLSFTHTGCICLFFFAIHFFLSFLSFHMFHQRIIARIVTLVAFLLLPLCVFKWVLKLFVWLKGLHWLHLLEFFQCVFSNVS